MIHTVVVGRPEDDRAPRGTFAMFGHNCDICHPGESGVRPRLVSIQGIFISCCIKRISEKVHVRGGARL